MKKQFFLTVILFFFSALVGCNGMSKAQDPVPTTTTYRYRAFRIPSLYPGVQW